MGSITDKKDVESEIWNAIAAFEQILDAIPNDRVALETLFEAYDQIGDKVRALEYLCRLANAIIEEQDAEAAPKIIATLEPFKEDKPTLAEAIHRLESLVTNTQQGQESIEAKPAQAASSSKRAPDITPELSLAWNLLQAGKLSGEHYSMVIQDLSDNFSKNIEVPITVLHVLSDQDHPDIEEILSFLSKDSGMPFIRLAHFDLQLETALIMPLDIIRHHGAIIFEQMEGEALVALLNPYNEDLKEEVRNVVAKPCHFYLISAQDYDLALEEIEKAIKLREEQ